MRRSALLGGNTIRATSGATDLGTVRDTKT